MKFKAYLLTMGLELKSATCKFFKYLIASGISVMSFLETSSSTKLIRFEMSGNSRPISLSLKLNLRSLTSRKNACFTEIVKMVSNLVQLENIFIKEKLI